MAVEAISERSGFQDETVVKRSFAWCRWSKWFLLHERRCGALLYTVSSAEREERLCSHHHRLTERHAPFNYVASEKKHFSGG